MPGRDLTRRNLLKAAGTAAVGLSAATVAGCALADTPVNQPTEPSGAARQFPKGFYWGTATSAYQIEGERPGRSGTALTATSPTTTITATRKTSRG